MLPKCTNEVVTINVHERYAEGSIKLFYQIGIVMMILEVLENKLDCLMFNISDTVKSNKIGGF